MKTNREKIPFALVLSYINLGLMTILLVFVIFTQLGIVGCPKELAQKPAIELAAAITVSPGDAIHESMTVEYNGLYAWLDLAEVNPSLYLSWNWRYELDNRFEAIENGYRQLEKLKANPDPVILPEEVYLEGRDWVLFGIQNKDQKAINKGKIILEGGVWQDGIS